MMSPYYMTIKFLSAVYHKQKTKKCVMSNLNHFLEPKAHRYDSFVTIKLNTSF